MRIRVITNEGKDDVYNDVLKFTYAGDNLFIYTRGFTFTEKPSEIVFFQAWEEE